MVHNRFNVEEVTVLHDNVEQVFVLVKSENQKCVIGCPYIPLNSSSDIYESHCNTIENIFDSIDNKILLSFIVCSDYNLPHINWINDDLGPKALGNVTEKCRIMEENFAYLNLYQINVIPNQYESFLDLVFTNNNCKILLKKIQWNMTIFICILKVSTF